MLRLTVPAFCRIRLAVSAARPAGMPILIRSRVFISMLQSDAPPRRTSASVRAMSACFGSSRSDSRNAAAAPALSPDGETRQAQPVQRHRRGGIGLDRSLEVGQGLGGTSG